MLIDDNNAVITEHASNDKNTTIDINYYLTCNYNTCFVLYIFFYLFLHRKAP